VEKLGVKAARLLEHGVTEEDFGELLHGLIDLSPGSAIAFLEGGIQLDALAKGLFSADFFSHNGRVLQPLQAAKAGFAAVLDSEALVLGLAVVFGAALAVGVEQNFQAPQVVEQKRILNIAKELEVGDRVEAIGASGMAADQHQVILLHSLLGPTQIVAGPHRLAIFVDAEEGDIQAVPGILKVVTVAAIKSNANFGGKDQPDIGITLVAVDMVGTTAEEGGDIAAQSGLFALLLLQSVDGGSFGLFGFGAAHAGGDSGLNLGGDVLDRLQNIEFQVQAGQLLAGSASDESVGEKVFAGSGQLLDSISGHVMVGHDQAVGRDERPGTTAVEAY